MPFWETAAKKKIQNPDRLEAKTRKFYRKYIGPIIMLPNKINDFVVFLIIVKFMATGALKCICNQQECDVIRAEDCPGKGMVVMDPCK